MLYLDYFNWQYFFEIVFWVLVYLILKRYWSKPRVRTIYAYIVAVLNLLVVGFFAYISMFSSFKILDAFAFSFLHTMVAFVMITLAIISKKIDDNI